MTRIREEEEDPKIGGTHAEGAGHPGKLTLHGWHWYYAGLQVEHTADCFGGAWLKLPLSTEV